MEDITNESITIDEVELYKQHKEEILNTPHSVHFEAIIPPISFTPLDPVISCEPATALETNDGCNIVTKALLIKTLQEFIDRELKDADVSFAYDLLCASQCSNNIKDLVKKFMKKMEEEKDDDTDSDT